MQLFELNDEQMDFIVEACTPVRQIGALGCVPINEHIDNAWRKLGQEMGFDYMTVRPAPGYPANFFEAEPID